MQNQQPVVQRIMRYLRTQEGPHCEILAKNFKYLHKTQERKPGMAPRMVSHNVNLYAVQDGWMYFPCGLLERCMDLLAKAGYCPQYFDLRKKQLATPDTSKLTGLRPGQLGVIEGIAKADCGIVDALTGFGKGVVIEKVVELYPKQKHLVVTKSKSVCNQLYKRLKGKFPSAGVWNSDSHIDGNPLMVTAGSLGAIELDKYDVVQLDEVHELMIPTFLEHYPRFEGCKMISYSASPDQRLDNTALAMEAYFGKRIATVSYQEGVDLGLVVPMEVWRITWDATLADALSGIRSDVARMRLAYWGNLARNTAISRVVYEEIPKRLAEKDPQILILVDKVEHALQLKKLLPDFEVVYGSMDEATAKDFRKRKLLDGDPLTPKQVEKIREKFSSGDVKRAIATGIWSTGVDFPQLSVIIRADGGASPIKDTQMPGRVCRISEGKEKGVLVDMADLFDTWAAYRSKSRFKNYKDKKWEILDINLSH